MGSKTRSFRDGSKISSSERRSILLTSNRAPNEWPDLFLDPLLASAGLARLLDRAEVVIIRGASYRAQGRTRLLEEVTPIQK
jgi:DNA replication protein DnaC